MEHDLQGFWGIIEFGHMKHSMSNYLSLIFETSLMKLFFFHKTIILCAYICPYMVSALKWPVGSVKSSTIW